MLDVQRNEEVVRGSELFAAPDEPAAGPSRGGMPKTIEWKNMRRPHIFGNSYLHSLRDRCWHSPEPRGQLDLGAKNRIVHI